MDPFKQEKWGVAFLSLVILISFIHIGNQPLFSVPLQTASVIGAGSGLVVHYTFDEETVSGKFGNAKEFDGVDDTFLTPSNLGIARFPFTISAWVKASPGAKGLLVGFYNSSSASIYKSIGITTEGSPALYMSNATVNTGNGIVADGNWHLMTAVFGDGSNYYLYVDGQLNGTYKNYSTIPSLDRFCVAYACDSTPSGYLGAHIDDVRVYDRALSAFEVTQLFTGDTSTPPTDPTPPPTNPPVTEPPSQDLSLVTTWYVDNQAGGQNDGTSWTNAYTSFSSIKWNLIKPGDTVFISGGITQKKYNEALVIGASGIDRKPITIRIGQEAGHNGHVVIENASGSGISMKMRSHIVVSGEYNGESRITVQNSSTNGVYMSSNTKIFYLNIFDNGHLLQSGSGVLIEAGADYFEIGYSSIKRNYEYAITQPNMPAATGYGHSKVHHSLLTDIAYDGLKGGLAGLDFYENEIGRLYLGGAAGAHLDMFQASNMMNGLYLRIYNNHIFDFTNSVTYFEVADGGTFDNFLFYNNVVEKATYGGSDQGVFVGRGVNVTVKDILISNNLFKSLDRPAILLGGAQYGPNVVIANNIILDSGSVGGTSALSVGSNGVWANRSGSIFDSNFISAGATGSTKISFMGKVYTSGSDPNWVLDYPTWKTLLNGDPRLDSSYRPRGDSLVINKGVNLSTYTSIAPGIARDKSGTARDSEWDIGPYEYTGVVSSPSGPSGDFDGDGKVTTLDWSIMNSKWNTSDTQADLNKDGKVNTLDFSILVKNWTF